MKRIEITVEAPRYGGYIVGLPSGKNVYFNEGGEATSFEDMLTPSQLRRVVKEAWAGWGVNLRLPGTMSEWVEAMEEVAE